MFYRELIYQAVIFLVIKPMVLKKSELTLPSKMQNTPFRQGKTFLTRGIVIIGCIRNVIWSSAFSIKSKLFAELLLVMISLLHRFLLSYTSLPFGFCLNNTTLLSFQIRSNPVNTKSARSGTFLYRDRSHSTSFPTVKAAALSPPMNITSKLYTNVYIMSTNKMLYTNVSDINGRFNAL